MSDADDIAELLRKAAHDVARQRKLGWIKGVFALLAAFGGASWTARGYLNQLATKEDITGLERQYAASFETLRERAERLEGRLSSIEPKCSDAQQCCIRVNDRLDRITTPRAFTR